MKLSNYCLLACLIIAPLNAVFASNQTASQPTFAIRNGDRVVFYGDSITDNSPYTYDIESWVTLRYPKMNVSWMNAGVGGDRVTGGWMGSIDQRMTRDLFSRNPTVITSMLGMNDASYQPYNQQTFDTFKAGYQHMVDRIHKEAPSARVWLIEPSPYDDVTRAPGWDPGYNSVLVTYGDFVKQLAQQNGYGVIDQNSPIVAMLQVANKSDPANAQKIIPDRIHPTPAGHLLSATDILQAWGWNPLVSSTVIDWKTGATTSDGSKLSQWKTGKFDLLENALPVPLTNYEQAPKDRDPLVALVLKSSDIAKDLNQETLTVNNMPAGQYTLSIDGKSVGTFSDSDFASGINLADLDTPMIDQAQKVVDMTGNIINSQYVRWRTFEFGDQDVNLKERGQAISALEKFENAWANQRDRLAQPVVHHFDIEPAT